MKAALRILALLSVPVVAVAIAADELVLALGPAFEALAHHLGWTLWVCGPLLMAVCLAIHPGDPFVRVGADVALVVMVFLNLGVAVLVALFPWVTLSEVFRFLPYFEFASLTLLLLAPLVLRWGKAELPKIRHLATLLRK